MIRIFHKSMGVEATFNKRTKFLSTLFFKYALLVCKIKHYFLEKNLGQKVPVYFEPYYNDTNYFIKNKPVIHCEMNVIIITETNMDVI